MSCVLSCPASDLPAHLRICEVLEAENTAIETVKPSCCSFKQNCSAIASHDLRHRMASTSTSRRLDMSCLPHTGHCCLARTVGLPTLERKLQLGIIRQAEKPKHVFQRRTRTVTRSVVRQCRHAKLSSSAWALTEERLQSTAEFLAAATKGSNQTAIQRIAWVEDCVFPWSLLQALSRTDRPIIKPTCTHLLHLLFHAGALTKPTIGEQRRNLALRCKQSVEMHTQAISSALVPKKPHTAFAFERLLFPPQISWRGLVRCRRAVYLLRFLPNCLLTNLRLLSHTCSHGCTTSLTLSRLHKTAMHKHENGSRKL